MKKHKPTLDFIGIGAQKSGTSWIDACLRAHPEICMGKNSSGEEEKEIHFFDSHYEKGPTYYASFFEHCADSTVKGEYTPMYLFDPKVPARIKEYCPDVKLIACLRNPVERAYSQYLDGVKMWGGSHLREAIKQNPEILERGFYARQIKRYLQLFPQDQIYIAIYEDIKKDPVRFIQNIYAFLGVDSSFVPDAIDKKSNASLGVHFKSHFIENIRQWIRHITSRTPRVKNILKKLNVRRVERALQNMNTETFHMKQKPEIYQETRDFLQKQYKPGITELESLLNRDLSHWK